MIHFKTKIIYDLIVFLNVSIIYFQKLLVSSFSLGSTFNFVCSIVYLNLIRPADVPCFQFYYNLSRLQDQEDIIKRSTVILKEVRGEGVGGELK